MGSNKNKISELLKTLTAEQREQLKLAHDYSVPQYIALPGNRFIGVNLNGSRHLVIEEIYNDWAIGTINYPK